LTTGVTERSLVDVADEALRTGIRARVAAGTLVGLAAVLLSWRPSYAGEVWGMVASVAGLVALHALVHGYHHGHDEGRRSGWVALTLASGPLGLVVVLLVVAATGGRGAGRVTGIPRPSIDADSDAAVR
jgi:hypothetical protein